MRNLVVIEAGEDIEEFILTRIPDDVIRADVISCIELEVAELIEDGFDEDEAYAEATLDVLLDWGYGTLVTFH